MQFKLVTKLHKPGLADDWVPRSHLLERLNAGLTHKFTLVSAPAGFGKTSLIAAWLASLDHPSAWLSIDEDDNDLALFVDYVTATIESAFPAACESTRAMLQSAHDAPPEILVTTLINDMAHLPCRLILVLDDYHTISHTRIHEAVARLIRHPPEPLHLVIISRTDPPLPLIGLRASPMTEIRANDLRFDHNETRLFLAQASGVHLSTGDLTDLNERIEGWVAGLRLALMSLRGRRDAATLIETLKRGDRHIMAYLADEVLGHLPPGFECMLLRISVLDRFCAELCDALSIPVDGCDASRMDGQALIAALEQLNLFLTPLDGERRWFRFHPVFQQLLRHRLAKTVSPQVVAQLHARAGEWHARQGAIDTALGHALAAGEQVAAAQLVEQHAPGALNREDFRTLRRWLGMLPDGLIETHASLLTIRALLTYLQGRYAAMGPAIARAAARAAQEQLERPECATAEETGLRRRVSGEVACLQAIHALITGDAHQAITLAAQALSDLPQSCAYMRSAAIAFRAISQQRLGQFEVAERWLMDELNRCDDGADTYSTRITISLCLAYRNAGLFAQLKATAERLLHMAQKSRLLASACWARLFLGVVSYEWNELDAAVAHLTYVRDHRYGVTMIIARRALIALALAQQAQGHSDDARHTQEMLVKYQMDMADSVDEETRALGARLALLSGQCDSGIAWAHGAQLGSPRGFNGDDIAHLTYVDMLLAEGTPDSQRQALDTVERVSRATADEHSIYLHIQALARQAVACNALGQRKAAMETLREALALARPAGLVRTFVDLGPAMERLLRLAKRGQNDAHLARILAAHAQVEPEVQAHPNGHSVLSTGNGLHTDAAVADLLTQRELQVLRLLQQHLSNKQIAQQLVITPETVQRHASNIFAKLSVHNRRQAVGIAREIGVLS